MLAVLPSLSSLGLSGSQLFQPTDAPVAERRAPPSCGLRPRARRRWPTPQSPASVGAQGPGDQSSRMARPRLRRARQRSLATAGVGSAPACVPWQAAAWRRQPSESRRGGRSTGGEVDADGGAAHPVKRRTATKGISSRGRSQSDRSLKRLRSHADTLQQALSVAASSHRAQRLRVHYRTTTFQPCNARQGERPAMTDQNHTNQGWEWGS